MDKTNKIIYIYISLIIIILVLIIGVTFAYFVAVDKGDEIGGEAATIIVDTYVKRLYAPENETPLFPQKTETIREAVLGIEPFNGICVDNEGNTVCQIYEIMVENKSDVPVDLVGELRLIANEIEDLKWGLGDSPTEFHADRTYPKTVTDIIDPVNDDFQFITLKEKDNELEGGEDTKNFYIVIYLEEKEHGQPGINRGDFSGEVYFNFENGGIKATFN